MANIIMCSNKVCDDASMCRRKTAVPGEDQLYDNYKFHVSPSGITCKHYIHDILIPKKDIGTHA